VPYFYCEPKNVKRSTLLLIDDEAHHAAHVLRHRIGDRIVAVDGRGMVYEAKIGRISDSLVEARIVKKRRRPHEPISSIAVAQGVLKGSRMDYAVEKLTELGVKRIIPFVSARSPVLPDDEGGKVKRWRRISVAAMKQSERSILPAISGVVSFDDLLTLSKEYDLFVLGWEEEKKNRMIDVDTKRTNSVLIGVGPEGGLQESEVEAARSAGAITLTLGERKLRSETASVVLTTLVLQRLGDI